MEEQINLLRSKEWRGGEGKEGRKQQWCSTSVPWHSKTQLFQKCQTLSGGLVRKTGVGVGVGGKLSDGGEGKSCSWGYCSSAFWIFETVFICTAIVCKGTMGM